MEQVQPLAAVLRLLPRPAVIERVDHAGITGSARPTSSLVNTRSSFQT